jgi:dihydroflavonol-4-reductase
VTVYVSGASGFVGSHVARELREAGAEVRDDRVELLDPPALAEAVEGCEAVVHVAALYSFDAPDEQFERVNVEGTRGPVPGRPATEDDEPPDWELKVAYKRTKLASERLALEAGAVVVNPTAPIGDGDRKPTPTGRMVANVAKGRMPAYLDTTGLNLVDVRDVARGHVLALEKGEPGERYILGGVNLPLGEIFAAIADLAGRKPPRLRVPYSVARAAAAVRLANSDEVRLARLPMYFTSAKARDKLGYAPGPVEPALARAVAEALNVDGKGGA